MSEKWIDKGRPRYYFVRLATDIRVDFSRWDGTSFDKSAMKINNCFRTKKEALSAKRAILKVLGGGV